MANSTAVHNNEYVGWQAQSSGRGTYDILKACGTTIFLLCWSSVCPNVPGLAAHWWTKWRGKFELFMLSIVGPDFIFMNALGQLNAAWRAKRRFHEAGYDTWQLRHCFFANMGGIHVQFASRSPADQTSFPVDCGQLLYLIQNHYASLPEIDKHDIGDRNKTDTLARAITIVQCISFTINSIGRVVQGLALTTLELTTLSFIFAMTATSLCWWCKPMDVSRPIIIQVATDLQTIRTESNAPTISCGRTPLSHLNRREWFISRSWKYFTQILRNVYSTRKEKEQGTHTDHFASVDFPEVDVEWEVTIGWVVPIYSAIFMAGWNFAFPTRIERYLWRAACTTTLGYGLVGSALAWADHNRGLIQDSLEKLMRIQAVPQSQVTHSNNQRPSRRTRHKATIWKRVSPWFDWMRNMSPERDPNLAFQLRLIIPTIFLCVAYTFARAYIVIEDFISLRSLPASAYQTVEWGLYLPLSS